MSSIASNSEDLILNADGGSSTVKFKIDGTEKASISSAGVLTATSFAGNPIDLGNWTITETGGVLYFATGGTNKMKLDASGNLTCVGDVTAYGSI